MKLCSCFCALSGLDLPGTVYISDTDVETSVISKTTTAVEVTGLDVIVTNEACDIGKAAKYFSYSINEKTFDLYTTKEFANVDEDAYTNGKNLTITLIFTLKCEDGTTTAAPMVVSIGDTNNHDPSFLNDRYEFNVAVPVMPKTDFSVYGEPIEAEDIDFSNEMVSFSVEPNDFTVDSIQTGNKTFKAVFSSKRLIQFTDDVVYTITATDSGVNPGPRSVKTIVTLSVDKENSLDNPSFSKAKYTIAYSEVSGSPILTPEEVITASTIKIGDITKVNLDGDYASYFKAQNEGNIFTITCEGWPDESENMVILTLSFETDFVASATLLITRDNVDMDTPTFENSYYTFSYTLEGDSPTLVPTSGDVTVQTKKPGSITNLTLNGDYAKYFEWHQGDDNITFTITLKDEPLPETTASPVVLTLSLKTDNVARVVILVSIENATALDIDVPVFSKAFYTLTYSLSTEVITSSDTISLVTEKPSDISEIRLEGEYEDYFIVTHAEDAKTFEISVKDEKQLPSNAPSPVLLTLSVQTDRAASVAIVIAIDESTEVVVDVPVFTRSFYSFNYSEKSLAPHDGPIYVVTKKPDSVTDVQIDGDYAKYFSYKQGENETSFILTLEVDLPSDVESPITLTFSVTTDTTARVILIVFVGNDSPEVDIDIPRFSRSYYSFTYTENDGKALLASNDGDVTVTTQKPDSVSDVKLLGDYREYFAIKVDKTTITLTVSRTLPNNTPTPVILMLTLKTDVETSVNFIVNIKNEDSTPQFSSPYFIGTYNSTTKQIDMDDKIEITGNPTLKISEDSGCSSYFDLVKDGTGYRLTVTKALPSDVLEQSSLVLVVVARLNGKDVAFATVVINLPVESMLPPSESDDKSSTITAYMITVIVLCIVLTSIIVAMILLWYFKIRNTSYVELEETSSGNTNFGKKNSNVNIDDVIRRPTGYPFGPHGDATYTVSGEETANEYDIPNDPELNKGKRVAFDNVVQSIDVDVDRELSEGGNNLPRRRPTGFVFNPPPPEEDTVSVDNPIYKSEYEIPIDAGQNNILYAEADSDRLSKIDASSNGLTFGYPMEEGLYETSDSLGIDKERKKSVAFDDRIERMQIDAVKDDEDEISDSENLDRAI
ncbi:uncharacterized protein LOC132697214 isoform X3 [Cylas formicarius]|uniref:uncharacterized protein LOC132697214 isoform X3 n=1 Tax=Cylas formicarius TaxID=197179 RepID=UPI002958CDA1|nr:uncharacterized protein LOC132697214 isoform X3 [Cylas formicarius]